MDEFSFKTEQCSKEECIFNEDGLCGTGIGCLSYNCSFLNSTIEDFGENSNEIYKSFTK